MKKITMVIGVLLALVCIQRPAHSQAAGHIAYVHGIFASNTELSPLAVEMHDIRGFMSDFNLDGYNVLGGWEDIPWQARNIDADLSGTWGSSRRVLVGHSMGGVEIRSIAQQFPAHTTGYVTCDAPNSGARFADLNARQKFGDAWAYDRGQIERQMVEPLGTLVGGILGIASRVLDFLSLFGQGVNGNIQDLVPGSTFMNSLAAGSSGEVSGFGNHRVAVWSTCISPRWPAFNSTNIQADQQTFWDRVNYCWGQNHYWDGEDNRLRSNTHWYNAPVMWARRVAARSRAGDYSAAANAYADMNASWEQNTADGQVSDSFISKASQQAIGRLDAGTLFQVGTQGDKTHQVNHGGAVFGADNGYIQIANGLHTAGAN